MSVSLLDVNVLIALFDPAHVHHGAAHRWFERNQSKGWASCPLTINGCIRVLSNPKYPSFSATVSEVIEHLRVMCSMPAHEFWPDSVSILDGNLFRNSGFGSYRHLTDMYLLGLATRRHGRFVTFDRGIPFKAVSGAGSSHLELIEPAD